MPRPNKFDKNIATTTISVRVPLQQKEKYQSIVNDTIDKVYKSNGNVNDSNDIVNTSEIDNSVKILRDIGGKVLKFLMEIRNTYFRTEDEFKIWEEIFNRYASNEEFNEYVGEILQ